MLSIIFSSMAAKPMKPLARSLIGAYAGIVIVLFGLWVMEHFFKFSPKFERIMGILMAAATVLSLLLYAMLIIKERTIDAMRKGLILLDFPALWLFRLGESNPAHNTLLILGGLFLLLSTSMISLVHRSRGYGKRFKHDKIKARKFRSEFSR